MKIYVTKYLFAQGIQEMDGEVSKTSCEMVIVKADKSKGWTVDQYFHGNDWHANRETAVVRAEQLRTKKLAALDKQRKKIEAMTFA